MAGSLRTINRQVQVKIAKNRFYHIAIIPLINPI